MILLFDIGASKTRVAVTTDGQGFGEPKIVPTPAEPIAAAAALAAAAAELTAGQSPRAVIGGLTRKRAAAADEIRRLFPDLPVKIENDAALCGLGEAHFGAGRGRQILAYLTVSTGVGGARIVGGQIDQTSAGGGFEPGHQIIDYREPFKPFEDYVSGAAVAAATGRSPRETTDPAFWSALAKTVAVGVHNLIVHWSPDRVVLGGGMFGSPGLRVDEVASELSGFSKILLPLPELRPAALGDLGGLHGALVLSRSFP